MMEFTYKAIVRDMPDSRMWNMHIDIPTDVVSAYKEAGISRLVCTYNGKEPNHCGMLSHGDGTYFIMINQERARNLGLTVGSQVEIHLSEDTSPYGMPMPEEMEELLRQDPLANHHFHNLTPGKQRSLLFIVGKPKGSETRLRKAIAVCEHLKDVQGNLDFVALNEAIKNSRFKR